VLVNIAKIISILANAIVVLIIIQVALSYFMFPFHPVRRTIDRIVGPMLAPIRKVVPLVGMFDFSPLILIVLVQILATILINLLVWGGDMKRRSFELHDGKRGAALAVRVTPRASKNEIVGVLNDGTVKVHLTTPPVEGQANEALLKFLAEVLGVARSRLDIVAGKTGRDKLVSVLDVDAETVHKRIVKHISWVQIPDFFALLKILFGLVHGTLP
jgi:uncharacterized protein (TIGR00251 family)